MGLLASWLFLEEWSHACGAAGTVVYLVLSWKAKTYRRIWWGRADWMNPHGWQCGPTTPGCMCEVGNEYSSWWCPRFSNFFYVSCGDVTAKVSTIESSFPGIGSKLFFSKVAYDVTRFVWRIVLPLSIMICYLCASANRNTPPLKGVGGFGIEEGREFSSLLKVSGVRWKERNKVGSAWQKPGSNEAETHTQVKNSAEFVFTLFLGFST